MVKNEQDVIEPFLRHNSPYFDAMIVLDNRSADRTREIALNVARELGTIFVSDLLQVAYDQGTLMSNATTFVQGAFFADFVFFLDADEFLIAPTVAGFHRAIEAVPVGDCLSLPWQTSMPDPALVEEGWSDPMGTMLWQRKVERPQYQKIAMRLGGALDARMKLSQGYHQAHGPFGQTLPSFEIPGCSLLHMPVRSAAQALTKGVVGWRANLARNGSRRRQAKQWKHLHDIYFFGGFGALSGAGLAQAALGYAQSEPAPIWPLNTQRTQVTIDAVRKYSDGRFGEPALLIAQSENLPAVWPPRVDLPLRGKVPDQKSDIENAFNAAWHWDTLFVDVAPFLSFFERHQPESVLDIGCGNGLYLEIARQAGAKTVFGVDGIDREATALNEAEYAKIDLQVRDEPLGKFELVMCLEVIEHVTPSSTDTVMDFVAANAEEMILFSMAEPGQPGNGHINSRSMDDVLAMWALRGWTPDLIETLGFRALSTLSWFRRNVVVLRRSAAGDDGKATDQLRKIGRLPHHWYSQAPGVRASAFAEEYPSMRKGYGLRRT